MNVKPDEIRYLVWSLFRLTINNKVNKMKHRYYVGEGIYWTKSDFRKNFEGSDCLFEYCWRKAKRMYYGDGDMFELLEAIATQAVNDEKSRFYIYG
jgi:hypothetical protein